MSANNLQLAVSDAKVIVGPVIGKVTNNTARVLVEVDSDVEVTCKLERANHEGGCIFKSKIMKKGIPSVFIFENLEPSTTYNVSFPSSSNHSERTGHFRTLEAQFTNMTFVSLSCNCLGEPEEPVVWNDLIDRYIRPGRVDTVIHLGDQVYADHAFTEGMKLVKSIRHAKEGHHEAQPAQAEQHEHHHHHEPVQLNNEQKHQIAEGYRDFYRRTWNYPPTREVLSSVANLMLWDDHDIRNDWGTHATDSDPNSDEYQVGLMARQVYWEYQRQLWDDILEREPQSVTMEGHFHRFGQVGVLFVDTRGSRSFYKDNDKRHSYISGAQWQSIQQNLGPQGIFSDVKNLIVVFSVALCCVGPQIAKLTSNALKDKVGFGLHVHEQIDLVKTFHHWKTEKADREIVLLGGDLHMAVETQIKYHNDVVLHQYITSPIRQHAPPSIALTYTKSIMNIQEEIGEGYTFRHVVFKPKRNFGIIQISASAMPNMKTFIYYQTKKNKSKEVFHSNYNDGELIITKISGKGLVSKDDNGFSDPYVKFNICGIHTKTPVLLKTLDPKWGDLSLSLTLNQDIYQHMLSKDDHPTLKLEVWDYDRVGQHDPMGHATINLHDFLLARDNFDVRTKTFKVDLQAKHKERVSGSVEFELRFRPLS